MQNSYIPKYTTYIFTDVFENAADFLTAYKANALYQAADTYYDHQSITDANATKLYYLLYARYGNSPIANYDVDQFKYKVWSIIYQYGSAWEKKLITQDQIRNLSLNDLREGSSMISSHAQAMGDDNIDANTDPVKIDNKTGNYWKKNKSDAYATLWAILKSDVTSEFLSKFKVCFKQFVMSECGPYYVTEEEDD